MDVDAALLKCNDDVHEGIRLWLRQKRTMTLEMRWGRHLGHDVE